MNYEKINSLKETINTDSLKLMFNNIKDLASEFKEPIDTNNVNYTNFVTNIFNYFFRLSESIFDTFVCEGGRDPEYSYKTFKLYYMPIFYTFLKKFFLETDEIKSFMKILDNDKCNIIYIKCEDSLFNYIALYYFDKNNVEKRYPVQRLLYSIIEYDCDSKSKVNRYKEILFLHFKNSKINEIKEEIDNIINDSSINQRTYTALRKKLKSIKTELCKKGAKYSDDERVYFFKKIVEAKDDMKTLSKYYSDNNKKLKELKDKYYYYEKLTKDEFERGVYDN